jgi:hypothetical protein
MSELTAAGVLAGVPLFAGRDEAGLAEVFPMLRRRTIARDDVSS